MPDQTPARWVRQGFSQDEFLKIEPRAEKYFRKFILFELYDKYTSALFVKEKKLRKKNE